MICAFFERRIAGEESSDFLNRCAIKAASALKITPCAVVKKGKKPVWQGGYVSLSHAGDYIVCVFSHSPVGVDMEERKMRDFAGLSQRFCGQNLGEEAFYRRWTAAESRFKSDGTPLKESLKTHCENEGRFFTFRNYLVCVTGQGEIIWDGDIAQDAIAVPDENINQNSEV